MWHKINNENELIQFMEEVSYFHDSCIKEISYLSGAYVTNKLSMFPINNCRKLRVIVQRQFENLSTIEMEFIGLKQFNLIPVSDDYTCEILDATMVMKDGCIYWCDCGELSKDDLDNYEGTLICSSEFRWRSVGNCLGEEYIYFPRD